MRRRTQIARECTPGLDPWTPDVSETTVEVGSNQTPAAWATKGVKVQADGHRYVGYVAPGPLTLAR